VRSSFFRSRTLGKLTPSSAKPVHRSYDSKLRARDALNNNTTQIVNKLISLHSPQLVQYRPTEYKLLSGSTFNLKTFRVVGTGLQSFTTQNWTFASLSQISTCSYVGKTYIIQVPHLQKKIEAKGEEKVVQGLNPSQGSFQAKGEIRAKDHSEPKGPRIPSQAEDPSRVEGALRADDPF
jgi:hypothetical protein